MGSTTIGKGFRDLEDVIPMLEAALFSCICDQATLSVRPMVQ